MFYLSHDTYILRGTITVRERRGSLGLERIYGPGRGISLNISHIHVPPAPLGTVFGPFWSENQYTLCPFWSGVRYGFQGNYGSV